MKLFTVSPLNNIYCTAMWEMGQGSGEWHISQAQCLQILTIVDLTGPDNGHQSGAESEIGRNFYLIRLALSGIVVGDVLPFHLY